MDLSLFLNAIFSPELALLFSGLLALIIGVCTKDMYGSHIISNKICLIGTIIAFICAINLFTNQIGIIYPFFSISFPTIFIKILTLVSGIFVLSCMNYQKNISFELSVLINFSLLGMLIMTSSRDFLTFYVSIELQSLCLYIMASSNRNQVKSTEAGLKYFILGALASGIMLFGISLIYGFTGQIAFDYFADLYRNQGFNINNIPLAVIIGLVLILVGLFFKISAAPFHMWTPDVYEGSPTIFTMFFALAPKLAIISVIIKIFIRKFTVLYDSFIPVIIICAVLTLTVGAFGAIKQTNLKRLLAYSSIANVGFILLGLVVTNTENFTPLYHYLTVYITMVTASFAILLTIEHGNGSFSQINQLAGFASKNSFLAFLFALTLFSLAGIPPFAGFFAKFYILQTLIHHNYIELALIALILSVVNAYYYLNIIKVMYFDKPVKGEELTINFGGIIQFITIAMVVFNTLYVFYYFKIKQFLNSTFISFD